MQPRLFAMTFPFSAVRRLLCILSWLCLVTLYCHAQGENNIWAFGIKAGLDFNSGTPQFFVSKSSTSEGCATVCGPDRQLLFYSDGNHVWDRNHNLTPNGTGLLGNTGGWATQYGSSTQGVAIVPFPADANKYYLFTLDCAEAVTPLYAGYLRYSVVDMSLNSGLGDVVPGQKNIVVDSFKSEKMTVAKGSGCFFWLVTHQWGSSEFRTYKIDNNGVGAAVSSFASSYPASQLGHKWDYMGCEIKVSPNQEWLASVDGKPLGVELFRFNNATGIISEAARMYHRDTGFLYGISFSQDGSKLYFGVTDGMGVKDMPLIQLDLSLLPDTAAVRQSATEVGPPSTWSGMRIGPDGRIYICGFNNNNLHYIDKPNLKGNACDVRELVLNVPDSVHCQLGFGNHVYSRQSLNEHTGTRTDTLLCFDKMRSLVLHARPGFSAYSWNTGSWNDSIDVTKAGDYTVISSGFCGSVTDTFKITSGCNGCAYIPSAFTPNNDGRNDYFSVLGQDVSDVFMMVYNRWGNQVYISTGSSYRWDGTYKGKPCEPGTYFYILTAKCRGSRSFTRKGDVTLVR